MERSGNSSQVGFLVKTYPKLSETFILGEILGLQKAGLPMAIYSMQAPTDASFHAHTSKVRAPVFYLPQESKLIALPVIVAHLKTFLHNPRRYCRVLFRIARWHGTECCTSFIKAGWLADRLRQDHVTHLHAHFASQPGSIAELVWMLTGMPYSISAHAKDIYLSDPSSLKRKLANARFTVTCTEHNKEYLESLSPPGVRILRMYHGIDARHFCPGGRHARQGKRPLLLSVGRLRAKKGFDTLVAACAHLRDKGVDFSCNIVGYGPEESNLRRLISDAGLDDHVYLLGKLTHDEVLKQYQRASAFVLPCRILADGDRDGIPNVLLEAMAMELPVVSTAVSGIPEAIEDGRNGLLVPTASAQAIADALTRLLADPVLRERLGRAGRRTVTQRFSHRNLDLLLKLLSGRRQVESSGTTDELGTAYDFCG